MTKYDLIKNTREVKVDFNHLESTIRPGCTLDQIDQAPVVLASFETEAEALKALGRYTASVRTFSSPVGLMAEVEEYLVEEYEANADGELISGSDFYNGSWPDELTIDGDVYVWRDAFTGGFWEKQQTDGEMDEDT